MRASTPHIVFVNRVSFNEVLSVCEHAGGENDYGGTHQAVTVIVMCFP